MNPKKLVSTVKSLLLKEEAVKTVEEVKPVKGFDSDKILVDTNVLMNGVVKNNFILCSHVIEELEKHKQGFGDRARNSRSALRVALNNPERCLEGV